MHMTVCHEDVIEPQATEYTCTQTVSQAQLQYIKHAAHKLVQHTLQVEISWTDDSTLSIFFYMSEEIGVQ